MSSAVRVVLTAVRPLCVLAVVCVLCALVCPRCAVVLFLFFFRVVRHHSTHLSSDLVLIQVKAYKHTNFFFRVERYYGGTTGGS